MFGGKLIMATALMLIFSVAALADDKKAENESSYRPTELEISESTTLKIFGFGDLLANVGANSDGERFRIGQAEIDLESELSDNLALALAVAYDDGAFTIGTFTADYNFWSANEGGSVAGVTNLTIGGGQYDVPFGIDYHVYPSIDRKLITSPLVVESTHDSWNDFGGYLSVEAVWGNAVAFIANGLSHEGEDPSGFEFETHNDLAIGGRVGIKPIDALEIGGSVAEIKGLDKTHDMLMFGSDMQLNVGSFELRGEYIAHRFESGIYPDFVNDGYYTQGLYSFGAWYIVGRYDEFRPDQRDAGMSRVSAGAGYSVNEIVNLRFEYQALKHEDDNATFQVAFGF